MSKFARGIQAAGAAVEGFGIGREEEVERRRATEDRDYEVATRESVESIAERRRKAGVKADQDITKGEQSITKGEQEIETGIHSAAARVDPATKKTFGEEALKNKSAIDKGVLAGQAQARKVTDATLEKARYEVETRLSAPEKKEYNEHRAKMAKSIQNLELKGAEAKAAGDVLALAKLQNTHILDTRRIGAQILVNVGDDAFIQFINEHPLVEGQNAQRLEVIPQENGDEMLRVIGDDGEPLTEKNGEPLQFLRSRINKLAQDGKQAARDDKMKAALVKSMAQAHKDSGESGAFDMESALLQADEAVAGLRGGINAPRQPKPGAMDNPDTGPVRNEVPDGHAFQGVDKNGEPFLIVRDRSTDGGWYDATEKAAPQNGGIDPAVANSGIASPASAVR